MPENCPIQITPLAQSQPQGTPTVFNLNYTNQDFWSMKSRLVDYIRQQFSTQFNDFVESDLAIMLIENWAFIADTLSFKGDQIANEVYIDTVTEIENAFRLAKLVGFFPQPPISARSMWSARLNNPLLQDLAIPAPLDVQVTFGDQNMTIELFPADANNNPIYDQDIIIPAGAIANNSIVGLEGTTYIDQFGGTGAINQTYRLGFFPVIWDSIRVDVDGVRWTQVDYFTDSQPRREYRVEFDSTYTAYIIFGNNRAGLIPAHGAVIQVTYRSGGGTKGNIVTNFAQTEAVIPVEGFDFSVPVSLSNYTKGEFGYDGDTIDDIRQKLPAYLQTQNRAVTGLDYKTLADQFATPYNGKVGKSIAVLRNYGCAANVVDLYVLAYDGSLPSGGLVEASNDLKVAIQNYFDGVKMFTDYLCIKDGIVITTDVGIEVVMDRFYRKFEDQFRQQVNNRTTAFFNLPNWEYGQTLRDTDLIRALSDIKEARRFEVLYTTNDPTNSGQIVTAQFNEIIRPDVTTISFLYE